MLFRPSDPYYLDLIYWKNVVQSGAITSHIEKYMQPCWRETQHLLVSDSLSLLGEVI